MAPAVLFYTYPLLQLMAGSPDLECREHRHGREHSLAQGGTPLPRGGISQHHSGADGGAQHLRLNIPTRRNLGTTQFLALKIN